MSRLHFTVPGTPKPKQRPRLGRGGHVYTPNATGDFERALGVYALQAMARSGWSRARTEPMCVWLHVYFPDERRRDLDNVAKCLDGVNGLVWRDDSQVHELHVYRRIDRAKPRLEVEVEAIDPRSDAHARDEDHAGRSVTASEKRHPNSNRENNP